MSKIVTGAYEECRKILSDPADKLRQVSDFLLQNDTMSREQFEACMENRPIGDEAPSLLGRSEEPRQ